MIAERTFRFDRTFELESGTSLDGFSLRYTIDGEPARDGSNVVWVCHALTGNAQPRDWWSGLVGDGAAYDPTRYAVVCANVIGSCYGSTGPTGPDFPLVTVRDMVRAMRLLRDELGFERMHTVVGGSLGGQQALEWAIQEPEAFDHLVCICTNAVHSPWGVAFNEAQRLAIEADPTFWSGGGEQGMKAARAVAMMSYRSYASFEDRQTHPNSGDLEGFRAASYVRYQGEKLTTRFNPYAYWTLSKAMDSHNVGRERGSIDEALAIVRAKTLAIGVSSDLLFPPTEQRRIAEGTGGEYVEIESDFGHDGFLVHMEEIGQIIRDFNHKVNA